MSPACSRTWSPTAVYRSATNDPPYSRLAASSRGAMSTGTISAPTARSRATAASNASAQPSASPASWAGSGTAMRTCPASAPRVGAAGPPAAARPAAEQGRQRVHAVGARHHRDRPAGQRQGRREHGHAVERPAGRHHAGARDDASRGLDADDAVQRGGHATGARRVRSEGEIDEAERHRDRRPGAGAAGDLRGIPGVADRAVRAAGADEAGRELVEVGLAEHDRAGRRAAGRRRWRPARAGTRTRARPPWWAAPPRRCCP